MVLIVVVWESIETYGIFNLLEVFFHHTEIVHSV